MGTGIEIGIDGFSPSAQVDIESLKRFGSSLVEQSPVDGPLNQDSESRPSSRYFPRRF